MDRRCRNLCNAKCPTEVPLRAKFYLSFIQLTAAQVHAEYEAHITTHLRAVAGSLGSIMT